MSKSIRSKLIKVISMVLVFSLVLSACSKGDSSESKKSKKKTKISEKKEQKYEDEIPDYWDIEDESDLPAEGDSEAVSFSPCAGVHVNAKENQLNPDTEITFTPFDDDDPVMNNAADILEEDEILMLGAWEVDCGLESEETLPGIYNVSIDLDYLGIDPDIYDKLAVFRFDPEGDYYRYNTKIEDHILHYSSNQNSPVILGCILAGVIIKALDNEDKTRNAHFYKSGEDICTIEVELKYGSYSLQWILKDADPELRDKFTRLHEIEKTTYAEAQKLASGYTGTRVYNNALIEAKYEDLLKKDKEYQKLREELVTNWEVPDNIRFVINCIDRSYIYLAEQGFKMPKHMVEFKCVTKGPLGLCVSGVFSSPYIELNISEIVNGDQAKRDNFLLTCTHELLHVCQTRYRTTVADMPRFDEMVAVILEEDAYDDFVKSGYITSPKEELEFTPRNYYGPLRLPIDDNLIFSTTRDDILGHEGYALAGFVDYLREKVNKDVKAKDLMDVRPYWTAATTTDPLMKVFNLTKSQVDQYFHDYLVSIRPKINANLYDESKLKEYKLPDIRTMTCGSKNHYDPACEGSDSLTINILSFNEEIPVLIIPDEGSTLNRGNVDIMPTEDYVELPNGYYVRMLKPEGVKEQVFGVIEIYGDVTDTTNLKPGYTVWGLAAAEAPTLEYVKEKDALKVTFPKKSEAAEAEVIDGYAITLKGSNGVEVVEYFPKNTWENENYIDFTKIRPSDQISNTVSVTATLSEYVVSKDGENILSLPSQEVPLEVKGEAYETCDISLTYGGEIHSYHIDGGRFRGVKFDGDDFDGSRGNWWLLGYLKRGDSLSISASTNSSQKWDLTVKGYNRDVTSSTTLASGDGMASFSLSSIPDDIYYVEIWWWNMDENRGIQISYEIVDEYTISGIPELVLQH